MLYRGRNGFILILASLASNEQMSIKSIVKFGNYGLLFKFINFDGKSSGIS